MGEDETLPEAIKALGIKSAAIWGNVDEGKPSADRAPVGRDWRETAFPWTVTLYIGALPEPRKPFKRPKSITVAYFMGGAHVGANGAPTPPTAADVLSSLASDISGIDGVDFASWAREMDMNPDSISALDTFKACQALAPRLRAFLGADFDRVVRAASTY